MLGLNCTALAVLSHAFLANAQRGDALVNVASVIGFSSMPGAAMYAGTKGFVVQFSRSLWEEQRRRGVYVMGYCPGATVSDFHETAGGSWQKYPAFLVQTSEQVADSLMHALRRRRKPIVVPGLVNRALLFIQRFFSLKLTTAMMGRAANTR